MRPRSSHGFNVASSNLTLKKFEELDKMMMESLTNLKEEVNKLKVEDYIRGPVSIRKNKRHEEQKDMPIKVLDGIINVEE